tara:strand:- start:3490 stop:4446 length:957 start_codon:yes stop_codon:yes gene_type:complete
MIYPTTTFVGYLIITLIYIIFKTIFDLKVESKDKLSNSSYLSMGLYSLLTTALILYVNISNSNEKCGPAKILDTMIFTLVPIILIQMVFMYLLKNNPGWKIPFSNTLGYWVVSLLGLVSLLPNIKDTVGNVFKKRKEKGMTEDVMLDDHKFLLNYLTPSSFCEKIVEQKIQKRIDSSILPQLNNSSMLNKIKNMGIDSVNQGKEKISKGIDNVKNATSKAVEGIRNTFNMTGGALTDSEKSQYQDYIDNCMKDGNEYLKKLYLLVLVKDYVSEAMLLCLVGFLVITKSYNTIINFKCIPVNTGNEEDAIKKQQNKLNQ